MSPKRYLIVFFALLLLVSQSPAHCVWQKFGEDGRGSSYYLDIESIEPIENNRIHVMMKRTLPENHEKYKEFQELIEIDCQAGSYSTLKKKLHRKDDVIEEVKGRGIAKPITANTPVDLLRGTVCR